MHRRKAKVVNGIYSRQVFFHNIYKNRNASHLFHTNSGLEDLSYAVQNLILKLQKEGFERHKIKELLFKGEKIC